MYFRIALCLLVCAIYGSNADVDIITEPRPGEEYVLVSSGQQTPLRTFETSHKIPEKHPQHHVIRPEEPSEKINKKLHSGKIKYPSEGIISIEEDKKSNYAKKGQKNKAAESIEIDVPVSKLEDIKIKENIKDVDTNPKMVVDLETISESGKLSNNPGTTTQKPILTTNQPTTKGYDYIPINFDSIDDINSGLLSSNAKLETAGSEQKQHSRIQIKKGPNGQDYEYEYIYYYYDEDEEATKKETKEKSTTTVAPVHNAHDGPQKAEHENQISREGKSKSKYSTIERTSTTSTTTAAPHENQNEVLHTTARGRQRGRPAVPAPVEEEIEGDRLPSSTRFPPRGRNLAAAAPSSTTNVPEVSSEPIVKSRGRSSVDSVADESIGQTRSRTRAHIRRPSSELVDLDSFKTHSGDIPSQYKELPSKYSTESKSTTESQEIATEKDIPFVKESLREGHSISSGIRFQEILDDSKLPSDYKQTTTYEPETTEYTTMTAMEKVALDLYAYLAGENLNNEINPTNDSPVEGSTTVDDVSTTELTTEEATTTTTTTTPAPTTTTTQATTTTTTTTTAAPTRPSRFKGRPLAKGRTSTTTTTEAPAQESSTRARGRFGKPSARKSTTGASSEPVTTAAPVEKPVQPKTTFGRRGFFAGRTRPSASTAAPVVQDASAASEAVSEPASPRPRLRPNLRRTTTTAAPSSAATGEDPSPSSSNSDQTSETTPAPQGTRTIGRSRPNLRPAPLRPGARLNIRANPRLRGGASTAAPETASEGPVETSAPESAPTEQQQQEQESEGALTQAPETPRTKLRTRLQVSASPRPRVAVTAPARRPNPLLKRKQLSTEAPTEATKKATEATEESTSAEKSETETEAQPAETTPAPPLRGLDALIARRKASGGIGARPSRPVRGAKHPK